MHKPVTRTRWHRLGQGFSLIELIIVLAIISILATFALPRPDNAYAKAQIDESLALAGRFQADILKARSLTGSWPKDNEAAEMPAQEKIIGNYMREVYTADGALHIVMGNKAHKDLQNKIISLQAVYVEDSPKSPVSWICGFDAVPKGMRAAGDNFTNVPSKFLPLQCR